MATELYVNIKSLPSIETISAGDLLLVETEAGTSILDFSNFIIDLNNTTFASVISSNVVNISQLQTDVKALQTVTASQTTSASNTYIGKVTITISSGNESATGSLKPKPPTSVKLAVTDFMICPANSNATLSGAYVESYDIVNNVVKISSKSTVSSSCVFNLMAIKNY
jgi:hypothetical protein